MKRIIPMLIMFLFVSAISAVPIHNPGDIVVKFDNSYRGNLTFITEGNLLKSNIPSLDNIFSTYGISDYQQIIPDYDYNRNIDYGLDMIYVFKAETDNKAITSVEVFDKLSIVEFSELNLMMIKDNNNTGTGWEPFYIPNDPMYSSQWFLPKIAAISAWDLYHPSNHTSIVAIVDDGCEKDHEDLAGNYITGYDYYSNDPDPTPPDTSESHGTHCSGLAAGVTNNGIGISAASYNVGLIGVRAVYLSACAQGIYFCSQHGADVISLSWGPGTSAIHAAIADAYNNYDVIIFGAAGNDNNSNPHYPAAYTEVVCVAASNGSDMKADFSNYGTWIDITAPGTSMLSTVPFGLYENFQGTSMSCPLAAGVAAMLRSFDSTITNDSTWTLMEAGCDPMILEALYLSGDLGAGRINAYRSLAKLGFTGLELVDYQVEGPGSSPHILPGEQGSVALYLACDTAFNPATNISVTASTNSSIVTFVDNTASLPNASPGDTVDNLSDLITFTISGSATTQFVTMIFVVSSTPNSILDTIEIKFSAGGIPEICIVNAELNGNYVSNYTDPLNNLSKVYDIYNRWTDGPIGSLINDYSMVIWYTGDATSNVLTSSDITDLTNYLNAGKDLFITGQNIAEDLSGNTFLTNYLHASYNGMSNKSIHDGVSGNIFDGLLIASVGGQPANQNSRDILTLEGSATSALTYQGTSDIAGLTHWIGGSKLVFFGFGFEAIHANGPFVSRDTVMIRILDWFSVGVEEDPIENPQNYNIKLSVVGSQIFTGNLNISAAIPMDQTGVINIYDMTGRRVVTLAENLQAGNHNINWNGRDINGSSVSTGNYIIKLITQNQSQDIRVVLVR